jgi:hypothetical protein
MGDKGYTIEANLEHWIDEQVNQFIEKKENEKFAKKLEKNMLTNICYGSNTSYKMVGWKGITIAQMLAHPIHRQTLLSKLNELKNKGENILNTNIPKDFLELA